MSVQTAPVIEVPYDKFGVIADQLGSWSVSEKFAREFGFRWNAITDPLEVANALVNAMMNEENWAKGQWWDVSNDERCTDRACYMGHIRIALWGNANRERPHDCYETSDRIYLLSLYTQLHQLSNEIASSLAGFETDIINFNDDTGTVWEDVYAVARALQRRLLTWDDKNDEYVYQRMIRKANEAAADEATATEQPTYGYEDESPCECSVCVPVNDEPPF